ncbi:MAG: DUF1700 domain-containing protein [Bacteroidota bacterium]
MSLDFLNLNQAESKRLYGDYVKEIKNVISELPKNDQSDILMEFNSHIFEALKKDTTDNEADRLASVLDRLGKPSNVLKSYIADKNLQQATKTFNPFHIIKALILNVYNGISYSIFILLYLFLFSFIYLIFAKLLYPSEIGLFVSKSSFRLGTLDSDNFPYQEILGFWFIPVMLLLIVLFYLLITFFLRLKQNATSKIKYKLKSD